MTTPGRKKPRLHDPLPAVHADELQLVQLFQNLVGNGIKYQNAGIPQVHISAAKKSGKTWIFSVKDNGLGIESQYFEKIFGLFQRLHKRGEYGGTGIGLAICKKIVRNKVEFPRRFSEKAKDLVSKLLVREPHLRIGCLAGGWLCDHMDRKMAYALYGVLQALSAVAMALSPRTEMTYIIYTTAYAFITGLTYAGFSAFVLEAMGMGAAATKYSVFASLSNTPIAYMTSVDGWAHGKWGSSGMLYAEAVSGMIGLVLFIGVMMVAARTAPAPAAVKMPFDQQPHTRGS